MGGPTAFFSFIILGLFRGRPILLLTYMTTDQNWELQ